MLTKEGLQEDDFKAPQLWKMGRLYMNYLLNCDFHFGYVQLITRGYMDCSHTPAYILGRLGIGLIRWQQSVSSWIEGGEHSSCFWLACAYYDSMWLVHFIMSILCLADPIYVRVIFLSNYNIGNVHPTCEDFPFGPTVPGGGLQNLPGDEIFSQGDGPRGVSDVCWYLKKPAINIHELYNVRHPSYKLVYKPQ